MLSKVKDKVHKYSLLGFLAFTYAKFPEGPKYWITMKRQLEMWTNDKIIRK